jgi:DNA mismatch endonuclease (patch repair protein)
MVFQSSESTIERSGTSWASSTGVRRSMQANRPRGTSVEVALRKALFTRGLRFFKDRRPLPKLRCEADVVFPRLRIAVFVDGCFWHGCPLHATRPVLHGDWWGRKLDRNMERDRTNGAILASAGWKVLRFWEHQSIDEMASQTEKLVRASSTAH